MKKTFTVIATAEFLLSAIAHMLASDWYFSAFAAILFALLAIASKE